MHLAAEWWADLWPNVVSPSIWTLLGIGASHWRQERLHRRTNENINSEREGR